MEWNHRLVLFPNDHIVNVMEVYYDDKGLPWGWCNATANHTERDTDSDPQKSIRRQLEQMIKATLEPVLNKDTDFTGVAPCPVGKTVSMEDAKARLRL